MEEKKRSGLELLRFIAQHNSDISIPIVICIAYDINLKILGMFVQVKYSLLKGQ